MWFNIDNIFRNDGKRYKYKDRVTVKIVQHFGMRYFRIYMGRPTGLD